MLRSFLSAILRSELKTITALSARPLPLQTQLGSTKGKNKSTLNPRLIPQPRIYGALEIGGWKKKKKEKRKKAVQKNMKLRAPVHAREREIGGQTFP